VNAIAELRADRQMVVSKVHGRDLRLHCGQKRPISDDVQRNQKEKPFLMGLYVFLYPWVLAKCFPFS
jgi:hypothetical protein